MFKNLCTPANIYLTISMIAIVFLIVQNIQIPGNHYSAGKYECEFDSPVLKIVIFAVKIVCVLFWTWILNLMCKDGYSSIAWFFVILPILAMFVFIATILKVFGAELKSMF